MNDLSSEYLANYLLSNPENDEALYMSIRDTKKIDIYDTDNKNIGTNKACKIEGFSLELLPL